MIARVTLAEIDPVRMSVERAVRLFEDSVVPALREQDGYEGAYVLLSGEGKVLALSFWATEAAADAGLRGTRSFYAEQVEKFVTLYRSLPGRETYDVVVADEPAAPVGRPGGRR